VSWSIGNRRTIRPGDRVHVAFANAIGQAIMNERATKNLGRDPDSPAALHCPLEEGSARCSDEAWDDQSAACSVDLPDLGLAVHCVSTMPVSWMIDVRCCNARRCGGESVAWRVLKVMMKLATRVDDARRW
jgi:hypothetical protein